MRWVKFTNEKGFAADLFTRENPLGMLREELLDVGRFVEMSTWSPSPMTCLCLRWPDGR